MMNRTLQYLKNVKFNSIVNKTFANQAKQKYNIMKNHKKHMFRYITVRQMTSVSFSQPPLPPNNNIILLTISAIVCGIYFQIIK
jgi:hypothetical protein